MKKIIILFSAIIISSALFTWSCDDQDAVTESKNGLTFDERGNSKNVINSTLESNPFGPQVGTQIPESTAYSWKENYKKNAFNGVESHFFGAETFRKLLNQPGATGISIHYALNDNNVPQLLLVAVNEHGIHLGETVFLKSGLTETDETWVDVSTLCPTLCTGSE